MRPPADAPRVHEYVRMLVSAWVVIACVTLASGVVGWWVWHNEHNVNASATFFVVAPAGAQPADAQFGNSSALSKTISYQAIVKSRRIAERAIAELGSSETPDELAKRVTVGVTESVLLELRVSGKDPGETRDTANALARNMVALSKEIETVDTGGTDLVLVDAASGVSDGRGPLLREVLLAGALGGALSGLLVLTVGLAMGSVVDRSHVDHVFQRATRGRSA